MIFRTDIHWFNTQALAEDLHQKGLSWDTHAVKQEWSGDLQYVWSS